MVEWALLRQLRQFYSPTQLCGGGTTKSNSNELPISVPLSR
ncbi:Peptide deformylase [Streptococcus sp. HSISM1]|nr:Peptide deformylase [Streptococcus sp. HSISM1]